MQLFTFGEMWVKKWDSAESAALLLAKCGQKSGIPLKVRLYFWRNVGKKVRFRRKCGFTFGEMWVKKWDSAESAALLLAKCGVIALVFVDVAEKS